MNKTQASSLLKLIAELYAIIEQPDPKSVEDTQEVIDE